MERAMVVLAALAVLFVAWQAVVVGREYYLRWRRFGLARDAARRRGKPLLVVGRPGGRLRIYGCGDVTMDLDPLVLRDCPQGGMVQDVRQLPFEDRHFGAAFCSHVLDCLPGPEAVQQAYGELRRVADEVFVCATSPRNLIWRWVSSEVTVWVDQRDGTVEARPHPRERRPGLRRFLSRGDASPGTPSSSAAHRESETH